MRLAKKYFAICRDRLKRLIQIILLNLLTLICQNSNDWPICKKQLCKNMRKQQQIGSSETLRETTFNFEILNKFHLPLFYNRDNTSKNE